MGKIKKQSKPRIIKSAWFNQEFQPEKHHKFIGLSLHREVKRLIWLENILPIKNIMLLYKFQKHENTV